MRRILCLGLFLLPLIGMFITLLNQDKEKEVVIKEPVPVVMETKDDWLEDSGIKYKQANRFETCENIDVLIDEGFKNNVLQANTAVSRIKFLEVLLKVHCIDYSDADISSIAFTDVASDDTKSKKIIQKSIEIGIANGYEIDGKKVFRADAEITKIEALAILRKTSGLELKDNKPTTLYTDIDVDWKQNVAHMSQTLKLLPLKRKSTTFNPDEIITNNTLSTMLNNILKYYR